MARGAWYYRAEEDVGYYGALRAHATIERRRGKRGSGTLLLGNCRLTLIFCLIASASAASQIPSATQDGISSIWNPSGRKYPARIYQTVRIQGNPPVIDGRLDDPVWKEGDWAGDYIQQLPTEGAKPSQPTELKILYDDRHIYMAIRAYDNPALVHRYPGRRDDIIGDVVGVCFDSYNSKRTGFEFDLTAGGSKIDLILGNGELEWDTTWDAVWDGEVAHDAQGWTAEFRIPLSQLRYGRQDEPIWGMHAWRWINRNQEESQWQLIPRQNTGRMHQLGALRGIRGLPYPRHVELLPHLLARVAPDRPGGGGTEGSGSGGLDAKIGLTSNFTLDATDRRSVPYRRTPCTTTSVPTRATSVWKRMPPRSRAMEAPCVSAAPKRAACV